MATPSSILTWEIPRTEAPGRLQSTVLKRVGHDSACTRRAQEVVFQGTVLTNCVPSNLGGSSAGVLSYIFAFS